MLQMVLWFGWAELMFRYWIFAALHFTNSAAWRAALPCRICCRFFIHPAAGPRGARGSRTQPGDGGKCFWGYTFHFQEFHCRHHCLIHQCSAFILNQTHHFLALCFNIDHIQNLFSAKLTTFNQGLMMLMGQGLRSVSW